MSWRFLHVSHRLTLPASLILLALAGCAAQPAGTAQPPASQPASPPATVAGNPLLIEDGANGQTVQVPVGARVELLLHSSYWDIAPSSRPGVLAETSPPTDLPVTPTCPPGVGCNPVEATFSALQAGSAVLSASRTSCGEAMACTPDQRHFQVTVVVTG